MKFGVLVFPGSNCDRDAGYALERVAGQSVSYLWHESENLESCDAILIPGGFAYGDYLRAGAIARFSPVMQAVKKFAHAGGPVLGICNGFQILCESGLLPGALLRNAGLRYICKQVHLRTETIASPFTNSLQKGQILRLPIGHMEGNYFCAPDELAALQRSGRIAFRYVNAAGEPTAEANPNGSIDNIAGILNESRNVLGMMPHPDRASEAILGSSDGFLLFESIFHHLTASTADAPSIGNQ